MRMKSILAASAAVVLITAAAPREEDVKRDKAGLKGGWSVAAFERNGKEFGVDEIKRLEWTFGANSVTIKANNQERESTYTLDPSKEPKQIDLTYKGQVTLGIYELGTDRLRICLALEGAKKRPTQFESKPRSNLTNMVLRRAKP
jgi:uncharacterized protein (TIGR03067 family)